MNSIGSLLTHSQETDCCGVAAASVGLGRIVPVADAVDKTGAAAAAADDNQNFDADVAVDVQNALDSNSRRALRLPYWRSLHFHHFCRLLWVCNWHGACGRPRVANGIGDDDDGFRMWYWVQSPGL